MPARIVIGLQWGDEGKAKFVDYFSEKADIVVRYQGGSNAGHTVLANNEKYVFHLIPSGIVYPHVQCVIANGVVVDPAQILQELEYLKEKGIDAAPRLMISDRAHIVLPFHMKLDEQFEKEATHKLGTTGRGIGLCYGDKVERIGIRVGDLFCESILKIRIENLIQRKTMSYRPDFFDFSEFTYDKIYDSLVPFKRRLEKEKMLGDSVVYLNQSLVAGKSVFLEGAQGMGLDLDFGTYPYVTASNPSTGGGLIGTGIGLQHMKEVLGICKAYTTRVGEGPFPTELLGEEGEALRQQGREIGATTGRPRRCGWFDAVILRYAVMVNGVTSLAFTKLDVLSHYDEIKIGMHYRNGKTGERFAYFPSQFPEQMEVEYETLPGWKEDISKAQSFADLPKNCQAYVRKIEELVQVNIRYISVGADRLQTMERVRRK